MQESNTLCDKCNGTGVSEAHGPGVVARGVCTRCYGTGNVVFTLDDEYTEQAAEFLSSVTAELLAQPRHLVPFCFEHSATYRRYRWLGGEFTTDPAGLVQVASKGLWTALQEAERRHIPGHSHRFYGPATYADASLFYIPAVKS